jgi:hypothetical protein
MENEVHVDTQAVQNDRWEKNSCNINFLANVK